MMTAKTIMTSVIGVSALLCVGAILWPAYKQQNDHSLRLPDGRVETPDTTQAAFRLPAFSLTDQLGKALGESDVRGKVVVFNFFYTFCPTVCPPSMHNLHRVQAAFAGNANVQMLSATLAPWHDTVDTLALYGQREGINPATWRLLTGDKKLIYGLSVSICHIGGMETAMAPGGIDHTPHVALFDAKGRLRGLYLATDEEEIAKLIQHAATLAEGA